LKETQVIEEPLSKTKVQIRAIDPSGNVDETPAKLTIEAGGKRGR
jgi:hypothetical protein